MRKLTTIARAILLLAATTPVVGADAPAQPKHVFTSDVLFWSQARREADFQRMEDLSEGHVVAAGGPVRALPLGRPLNITITTGGTHQSLDEFMDANRTGGVLVIQDGRVRLERYKLGFGPGKRWTSFSVAKSITSTLVGAAVKDGYIASLDDRASKYLPILKGGGYDGVTVRQILTMTSGVKWNEDYSDPKSDVAQLFLPSPPGVDRTLVYMSGRPREATPGTRWNYNTGETNLIGRIVAAAIHKPLAGYLSEKIWRPFGMETNAAWLTDELGQETGGCCLSVTLRDYGRIGLFVLADGKVGGNHVVPDWWFAAATHKQVDIGDPGHGYGYQWWTDDVGTVNALGIFGQAIHIDPKRHLVVVMVGAWPRPVGEPYESAQSALFRAVEEAVDAPRN